MTRLEAIPLRLPSSRMSLPSVSRETNSFKTYEKRCLNFRGTVQGGGKPTCWMYPSSNRTAAFSTAVIDGNTSNRARGSSYVGYLTRMSRTDCHARTEELSSADVEETLPPQQKMKTAQPRREKNIPTEKCVHITIQIRIDVKLIIARSRGPGPLEERSP